MLNVNKFNETELVKKARKLSGLTQTEFGAKYGYNRDAVNNWENRRCRVPGNIIVRIFSDYPKLRPWK